MRVLIAFLLAISCIQTDANEIFQFSNPSIIIVGSGPAGIAAATVLLKNNLTNIKILEAESRIGGRINTVTFGKRYIDLGAEYCDGEGQNIVYNLVKNLNLLAHYAGKANLLYSNGQRIDDEFAKELLHIMGNVDREARLSNPGFQSKGEFCEQKYNDSINTAFKLNAEKLAIAQEALKYYELRSLITEGGESLLNVALLNDFVVWKGDRRMNWKGRGFQMLFDVLVEKYPFPSKELPFEGKILLNKEVTKISWEANTNGGVKILCTDKSTYEADHVIFTPSVGVLKERHEHLFEPSLPTKKQEAIKNIGVGTTMKVFMYYPDQWWQDDDEFHLIWNQNDMEAVKSEFTEGPIVNGRSWITYISIIRSNRYTPNVLLAWITGELVPIIEELPDEILKNGLQFILHKFLSQSYNLSELEKIVSTKWHTNPHFRASYSYQSLKTSTRQNGSSSEDDLAAPLKNAESKPIVQFAGEATHPTRYGSVDGAVETGFREARILVDLYKR